MQATPVLGEHHATSEANSLYWLRQCIDAADKVGDDFCKAVARIDCAASIILGADGVVGYRVAGGPSAVRRDCRTHGPSPPSVVTELGDGPVPGTKAFAVNIETVGSEPSLNLLAVQKERKRWEAGVPLTVLEKGETRLVDWWVPVMIWNEAVPSLKALEKWKCVLFCLAILRGSCVCSNVRGGGGGGPRERLVASTDGWLACSTRSWDMHALQPASPVGVVSYVSAFPPPREN
jgi:hypothetical protein